MNEESRERDRAAARIIVVDDQAAHAEILSDALISVGHDCSVATTIDEARDLMRVNGADIRVCRSFALWNHGSILFAGVTVRVSKVVTRGLERLLKGSEVLQEQFGLLETCIWSKFHHLSNFAILFRPPNYGSPNTYFLFSFHPYEGQTGHWHPCI